LEQQFGTLNMHTENRKCRVSFSFGIGTGYGLEDQCSGVRFPTGAGDFSLLQRIQTGSGTHPASYPVGTGGSFPAGKMTGV
jgi:hypothetical protein